MSARLARFATLAALGLAAAASAQPQLTALGGSPAGVSNAQAGTTYISSFGTTRWSINGATLTPTTITGTNGGIISADGAFQSASLTNAGTVPGFNAGVIPAFGIPSAFATSVLPAGGAIAARWTAGTNTVAGLPGIPNNAYSQSFACFGSGDSGQVHSATAMSRNGRFIGVQSYIATYAYSNGTTSLAITDISCSGGTATVTTAAPHAQVPGALVVIAGNSVAGYNNTTPVTVLATPTPTTFTFSAACGGTGTGGTYTFATLSTVAVTNITCASGTATVSTGTTSHLLAPGNQVNIAGNSVAAYNGVATVLTTPTATTFTYAATCGGTGTGGTLSFVAGTRVIAANTFRWRAGLWDGNTNTMRTLSSPFRTSAQTGRRRDTTVWGVSDDGLVVVGAQEHSSSTTPASTDPDGGRLVVWRWDAGLSDYVMTYLPNGVNGSGFPITYSTSQGTVHMNGAGTIIVGPAVSDAGALFIGKWVWNAGTSTWDAPINLGSVPAVAATWLPSSVTSCGLPPTLTVTGMSEDGNTVVGFATYSTCSGFMRGGWIWTSGDGLIQDWYDYLNGQGVVGCAPGISSTWGPVGELGNYTKGLPRVGNPQGISPDGTIVVGSQGGNQVIVGAPAWVLRPAGSDCVLPAITTNSAATANFSRCNRFVNLTIAARGSSIAFQWYRTNGGAPIALTEGLQGNGMNVIGAGTAALSLIDPKPADADTYYCVVTGPCGTAQSTNSVVQVDPTATTPVGDTCGLPRAVGEGTFTYNPCGAWTDDVGLFPNCVTGATTGQDVWFSYTPSFTGNVRIETCLGGFDSVIGIYDVCNGTELACNDDLDTGPTTAPTCSSNRSRIARYPVVLNQPILVRVAAKYANGAVATSSNNGQVTFSQAPAESAGNNCTTPIAAILGANPFDTTESTYNALDGGTSTCSAITSRDVWFSWTAPSNGKLRASTCPPGNALNTVLSIYNTCGGGDIACNDNAPAGDCGPAAVNQSVVKNLSVLSGINYLVRVGTTSTTTFGAGIMTLSFVPSACNVADITEVGGTAEAPGNPDGQLTVDDIIVFVNLFSDGTGCPGVAPCSRADVTAIGGLGSPPDGQLSVDDVIEFFNAFADGCPA